MTSQNIFTKSILIACPVDFVWEILVNPTHMKKWMAEPELLLNIKTTWEINSPLLFTGFHHLPFENRGNVIQFEKEKRLHYTHISSLSRLQDEIENYTHIVFDLSKQQDETELRITLSNFPTETIYKHLEFYWIVTLSILKNYAESLY